LSADGFLPKSLKEYGCLFCFNGKNNFQYLLCYAQHKISNVLIIFRMLQHLLVNDNIIIMLGFVYASSSVKETVHYLKIVRAIKAVFLVMM